MAPEQTSGHPGLVDGKVVLVSGAGSRRGIGLACGEMLAAHGAKVVLLDIDAEGVQANAAALGPPHFSVVADVRDRASCERAVGVVESRYRRLDALVHIAGIVRPTRVMDVTEAEYDRVMDINLRGTLHMCQAVIPLLRREGSSSIACMSSVAAQRGGGVFGGSHYSASKAGVLGLVRALARELAPDGIRVNAVAPGPIDTDITGGPLDEEWQASFSTQIPLGRIGTSADVAGAFLFLVSNLSAYMTGSVIDVNGGLHIH
jgi:NAD(P)-dependent dehydrogenase (short-subunit alcohol dehydrogenase family)